MIDPRLLVDGIRVVVEEVRTSIPEENVRDAYEFIEYAEWGEALSLICTQLYEYDVPISNRTYEQIEWLGQQMEMAPKQWTMLKELVQTSS